MRPWGKNDRHAIEPPPACHRVALGHRPPCRARAGAVGSAQVARAEPDGYTFVNAGSGPHLTGPAINPNIGYDPLKDFTHVAMEAADNFVLVASSGLGAKSVADLI